MGGTDERKTKRKQRKGDKCIGGVGQVGSDRTEGTEIKSWTKSAEFLKGGLKQGKKYGCLGKSSHYQTSRRGQ